MDGISLPRADRTGTLTLQCPVCASDAADTLGVTGGLDGSTDATVVMRCDNCLTVYLTPIPVESAGPSPGLSAGVLTRRRINRWTRGLPSASRILCVDCAAGEFSNLLSHVTHRDWVIENTNLESRPPRAGTTGVAIQQAPAKDHAPGFGEYDLILLLHSLEAAYEPNALLGRAASLLADGGRVVAIGSNADSWCFAAFGGRHWCGYQFPRTRQHLTPRAIRKLGDNVGLRIKALDTLSDPDAWLMSLARWLRDWGANKGAISLFTGRWLVPQIMTSILEGLATMRGRGSMLVVEMQRQ
jgi:hypothetical protein